MKPTLEGARLKLKRSEELLDEVKNEYDEDNARRKLGSEPSMRVEIMLETGLDGSWFVAQCVEVVEPKQRWGILAGDAIHNTRSALDHLACRLVELAGNKWDRRTAFPIWDTAPRSRRERNTFKDAIRGMRDEHKDSIKKLQPYALPGTREAAMLVALAGLDIMDKHQSLLPMLGVVSDQQHHLPIFFADQEGQIDYRWNSGAAVQPGAEILRYRPRDPRVVVTNVDLMSGTRPTYGDTSTGLRELREIRAYVVGIVESFAPEFS